MGGGAKKGLVYDLTFLENALADHLSIKNMEPSQKQLDLLRYREDSFAVIAARRKKRIPLPFLIYANKGTEMRIGITQGEFDKILEFIAKENSHDQ